MTNEIFSNRNNNCNILTIANKYASYNEDINILL
jgi:hypothetical protein